MYSCIDKINILLNFARPLIINYTIARRNLLDPELRLKNACSILEPKFM